MSGQTTSDKIIREQEKQAQRDLEYLPLDRREFMQTPMRQRRTVEEIERDFLARSVACVNCGKREVPQDDECGFCGVKRTKAGAA